MVVDIWIAHAAAVEEEAVVEQRAIALFRCSKLGDVFGEEADVEGVDLRHALNFRRVIAVMGKRVVRIADADFGVGAVAGLAGELEGDHAGDIALHSEELQIKHEPCVLGITGRHSGGA